MKIGCFAVVDPFETIEHQLDRVAEMGFEYADVTDNHPGGLLGREFGFAASVSLDDNPDDVKQLFEKRDLTVTSVCAHANLLDPSAPGRYGTEEIMKAIRLADGMDVDYVITTEGEPKTEWGEQLSRDEQVFTVTEKLHEPVRLAESLGVKLLIEPHGELTDPIDGMQSVLDHLGHPDTVGVNLDTGNAWLGGADPVEFAETFSDRIQHVHWKDLPEEWEDRRGDEFGCGMSPIPLGEGIVDIEGIYRALEGSSRLEHTTLEIAGEDNLVASREYLETLGAE